MKRNMKIISMALALVVVMTLFPTIALQAAVSSADEFYTQVAAFSSATADVTIEIGSNLTLDRTVSIPVNPAGCTLTIRSIASAAPFVLTRGVLSQNGLFVLADGAKLVLENIIIDGAKDVYETYTANGPLVEIKSDGIFTMREGAVLQNNINNNTSINNNLYGGGVHIYGGTFNMSGGKICDNITSGISSGGGGVHLSRGTFNMSGGEISGNSTPHDGGGVFIFIGKFHMSGGKIFGNTAGGGGGVGIPAIASHPDSEFNMRGGEISGNKASSGGGVSISSGTFDMSGGRIIDNEATDGGGVIMSGGITFYMKDGEISNNRAISNKGSIFSDGGGVFVHGGRFYMSGGKINGNYTNGAGGGVFVGNVCTFNMNGGEISGNTANSCGGVLISSRSTFNMSSGEISGNTAINRGGISLGSGTNIIGGTAVIRNNTRTGGVANNAYLMNNGVITLGTGVEGNGVSVPAAGMEIWVDTSHPSGVIVESGATENHTAFFRADENGKTVVHDAGKLVILTNSGNPPPNIAAPATTIVTKTDDDEDDEDGIPLDEPPNIHLAYLRGYEDGTFRQDGNATRAEFVTMVCKAMGIEPESGENFLDTHNHWAEGYIVAAKAQGWIIGYEDETFRPQDFISRAESVSIMYNVFTPQFDIASEFGDISGHWAEAPIVAVASAFGLKGYPDGTFKPKNLITRGELVIVVNAACSRRPYIDSVEPFKDAMQFLDVPVNHFAYWDILEASVDHIFIESTSGCHWESLSYPPPTLRSASLRGGGLAEGKSELRLPPL